MDMSNMSASSTATTSATMGSSTSSSSMSMGSGSSCKISMLWNWYTVDACFISRQWHITTIGMYVGSVFAVFFLVILLEYFRRLARDYDRRIVKEYAKRSQASVDGLKGETGAVSAPFTPSWSQQAIRSFFYFVQFGAGYMLMLLAMYYNGGFILAIFFGAYAGHFISARDTVGNAEVVSKDCCC